MRSKPNRRVACALAAAVAIAHAPRPCAASPADDKKLATELFDKGVDKMDAGKCDQPTIGDEAACREARDLFQRSYALYPEGLGALRNLAYVELGLKLYASAARSFRELEQKAPNDPNPKRHVWAEYAHKELETLAPKVPHLTIVPPSDRPADLVIALDDEKLPPPAWGTAIDVDPGAHTLKATAQGRADFVAKFDLATGESKTVEVSLSGDAAAAPKTADVAPAIASSKGPSRVAPLVLAGAGVVVVGVGLVFGARAISKRKDACGDSSFCDPQGLDDARSAARTSNVVTGVGAAMVVGGVVWYLLTPDSPSAASEASTRSPWFAPWASAQGGGLAAGGRF